MKKFIESVTSGGRAKVWRIFIFIAVITTAATLINLGPQYNKAIDWIGDKAKISLPHMKEISYRLGLDLLGGTQLTYEADVSNIPPKDRASSVEGVREVIEKRVNAFGVAEPNIQTNYSGDNYFVLVELAGIKDTEQAIKMIGETPLLQFKEMNQSKRELTKDEKARIEKANKESEKKAKLVDDKLKKKDDFAKVASSFSDDTETKDKGGDLGLVNATKNPEIFKIADKLKVGQISSMQKTPSGYEFVKLLEKKNKLDPFTKEVEKEFKASHLLICYKDIKSCESGLTKEEAKRKIESIKAKITPKNFSQLVKENSTEPGAKDSGGQLGWFGRGAMVKPFENGVQATKKGAISDPVESEFGYHLIYKEDERVITEIKAAHILIKTLSAADIIGDQSEWTTTELTGKNLNSAIVVFNPNDGTPQVSLEFNEEGSKQFGAITERNIGKQVAIYLDGYEISAPTVNEKITGGKAVISGRFDIREAKLLAQRLNAGALPVPINLVNQQTVGATLGAQSVNDSLRAGLIGFALVALFMIIFYRLPGFLAVLALMVYTSLVLAIFKATSVTLTLSGLAGFIMSIGMAVDANILIFARLKEELAKGKPLGLSIEEGFKRAWPSIRDSNASTLITCFILIQFSTSVVRGFAITLSLGVIISMFTAIFVTRTLLKLLPENWLLKHLWLIGKIKN